jgi:hypothetical protein
MSIYEYLKYLFFEFFECSIFKDNIKDIDNEDNENIREIITIKRW